MCLCRPHGVVKIIHLEFDIYGIHSPPRDSCQDGKLARAAGDPANLMGGRRGVKETK